MDIVELNRKFKDSSLDEVFEWVLNDPGIQITLACSFSIEDSCVLNMMTKIKPDVDLFFLDTGRLHEETYEQLESTRNRYPDLDIRLFFPQTEPVQNLVRQKGAYSFFESVENRKQCCAIRKVEPLGRALADKNAWITGMRQEHSANRGSLQLFEEDTGHDVLFKLNPLFDWTQEKLQTYANKNNLSVHSLHKKGYPSIGCAPCTRAITEGEEFRAGRWWWESDSGKECGLHN